MSFINVITNNQTSNLNNAMTYADNWVFVPGVSKTGNYDIIHAFKSVSEFEKTCGIGSPDSLLTYEYVCGLLNAGLPVLFKRIAHRDDGTLGVTQAEFVQTRTEGDEMVQQVKFIEKWGGTFGNELSIVIRVTDIATYIDIKYRNAILETRKVCNMDATKTTIENNQAIIDGLKAVSFDRVTVEVIEQDPEKLIFTSTSLVPSVLGTDFTDEEEIKKAIPATYHMIEDKMLYSPKFITSGGFTDSEEDGNKPIFSAMQSLSKLRQDCRVLVDLPLEITADDIQNDARIFAYTQTSGDAEIPSMSMCAPWCYMQVGNTQLWMPPSYVYLTVVGHQLSKGDPAYTPKAGLISGVVTGIIRPRFEVGARLSQAWQETGKVNINPIMRLQSGNYVIAGNSTLLITDETETNAFSESSADLTVLEIRRFVYGIATELQYQYNSATAFETFALRVSNFLEKMRTEGALTDYTIANVTTADDPRTLKVRLDVMLTPTIKNIEIYLNVSYGNIEVSVGGDN